MICGVDANVLIYSAIQSVPEHGNVLSFFERRVLTGELTCAVTFPVLLEFVHITKVQLAGRVLSMYVHITTPYT